MRSLRTSAVLQVIVDHLLEEQRLLPADKPWAALAAGLSSLANLGALCFVFLRGSRLQVAAWPPVVMAEGACPPDPPLAIAQKDAADLAARSLRFRGALGR